MSCDRLTEAISAAADGEDPGMDGRLVDAHLARCASCRQFAADIEANRRTRVREALPMPDLSRRIMKLNAMADRAARWGLVRGLLAICAIQISVLSAPALLLGDETGTTPHGARHLGAFSIAYAVGLLVVAVRPARARTMLPVAAVLGVALLASTTVDLLDTSTGALDELLHIPDLLSVVLVWLLARPSGPLAPRERHYPIVTAVETDRRHDKAI